MLESVKWGEFRYDKIYKLQKIKYKLSKDACISGGKIPLFTSDSNNNGIVGYVNHEPTYVLSGNEYMLVFGDHTRTFNIANYSFCVADNVKVLKPVEQIGLNSLLFINSCWKKQIINKGYSRHWSIAKDVKIKLPITNNGSINFDFMEKFIAELEACHLAELEACHLAELEAYLNVTELIDYRLTDDEKNLLYDLNNNYIEMEDFVIGDIFNIKPTIAYKLSNLDLLDINGKTPVVSNSGLSNGITGYSKLKATEEGNMITYSDTTTSEAIFYQKNAFIGYSHIQGLYPIENINEWNESTLLYFVTIFKKTSEGRFSYGNKFNRKIASKLLVKLPVKNGEIDFRLMNKIIKIVKKLVIKDVVDYSKNKIEATSHIINNLG